MRCMSSMARRLRLPPLESHITICSDQPRVCHSRIPRLSKSSLIASVRDASTRPLSILPRSINNVDQRLSRVEKALDTLSSAINASLNSSAASRGISEAPSHSATSDSDATASLSRMGETFAPELTLDDSHSFSYLGEASRHLDIIKNKSPQRQLAEHQAAATALQDLSKSLTTVSIQPPCTNPVSFESLNGYYVPSRAAGYNLISCTSTHSTQTQSFKS